MANVKLVYLNSTGGYPQPTTQTDVVTDIGKIEMAIGGVAGVAFDAGQARVTNLALVPVSSSEATSKAYVDSVAAGLTWGQPVAAVATSPVTLSFSQTVDGVTLLSGARVLITGQNGSTPDDENGIYVVNTSGVWTRAADVLKAGYAVFSLGGTSYADTQWVLATPDVNPIVPDTTPILFAQAGASTSLTAGNGISIVSGTISAAADGTAGITVGVGGIAVNADTAAGLDFDGITGKLQINLDTDSGLEFNSTNGLRIDVASTDELSLDANGLNVEGVPSQFKIGGSAVSANVTQTNLDALTDSSTITGLHRHGQLFTTATVAVGGLGISYPVYFNASGEAAIAAANSPTTSGVIGISMGTYAGGATAVIQTHGECDLFGGLTPGVPYYLDDTGGAIEPYSSLTSGNRAIRIGYAKSATTLIINIQDMGVKP